MAVAAGCPLIRIAIDGDELLRSVPSLFWWKLPDERCVLAYRGDWKDAAVCKGLGASVQKLVHWIEHQTDKPSRASSRTQRNTQRNAQQKGESPRQMVKAILRDRGRKLPVLEGDIVAPISPQKASLQEVPSNHRRAREQCVSAEIVQTLAAQMAGAKTLISSRRQIGVLLFNVAGWTRGGLIRMDAAGLPVGEFELIDPTTGGQVLYFRQGRAIEFIAPPVPAGGFLFLEVKPVRVRNLPGPQASWEGRQLSLHFEHYVLQFHPAGGMSRWHDRARSMQWCSNLVDWPMGMVFVAPAGFDGKFSKTSGKLAKMGGKASDRESRTVITSQIGPLRTQVIVEADCVPLDGWGDATNTRSKQRRATVDANIPRYRTTFTLYHGQRELFVRMELLNAAGASSTGTSAASNRFFGFFPMYGEQPFVLIDRTTHLVEPSQDFMADAMPTAMNVHRGIRVECKHTGLNFYPLDTSRVGFGTPPIIIASGLSMLNADVDRKRKKTLSIESGVYTALNYAGPGKQLSNEFIICPTGNDEWDGGLARGGLGYFRPIIGVVTQNPPVEPARSIVRIEPDLVHLVAMKPADDGDGLILRLWSADPDPLTATVTFGNANAHGSASANAGKRSASARRHGKLIVCDVLERYDSRSRSAADMHISCRSLGNQCARPGDSIAIDAHGRAKIPMRPHEIVTLRWT